MKIKFLGAAQTVTGSCYVLYANGKRFAVDCGMHQGNRHIEGRNFETEWYEPSKIDFFLITHAHIDHSGLLPRMVKEGFRGKIYATPPTRDLLDIMLLDSAHIQEMDTDWRNKKKKRHGGKTEEPLYTQADVEKTMPMFEAVEYNTPFEPAEGVRVIYKDAGHILGSAFIELSVKEGDDNYRLIFSGDLGRPDQLLLKDPVQPLPADYLFMESTYGDRNHKDENLSRDELAEAISYSYEKGEKVIIPAFAVERTQEVLYTLYQLHEEGRLPEDMPVFLDSPLAIRATEIFRKHPKYFDSATQAILESGKDPLDLPNLKYTLRTNESQAINESDKSAVVISASGMCNAGRIKHHLRHNLWKEGASVVFVGYQAEGTPGRRIVDGVKKIRLLNEDVAVKARIFTIGGFSAHAGQSQIMDWLRVFSRPEMEVLLIHGEIKAQQTLAALIKEQLGNNVLIPEHHEEVLLKPGQLAEFMTDPDIRRKKIDWSFLMGETETKVNQLRARLAEVENHTWIDQNDIRDKMLEINRSIAELISEV